MKKHKPNIGVTGPDSGGEAAWWFTMFAIWLHGGKAVRITPSNHEKIESDSLDGLILGGGADINPEHYGAELLSTKTTDKPKPSGFRQWIYFFLSILLFPFLFMLRNLFSVRRSKLPDAARGRDDLEFSLLQEALEREIPVLGICRGSQLINVQFGGSLHQDIGTYYTEIPQLQTVWPEKKVKLKPGSRLVKIIGMRSVWVNALHNQAVDRIGSPLTAVAKEDNEIIQAIEHPDHPFLIGVQWHPEYMPQIPSQRNIFKELVDKARGNVKTDKQGQKARVNNKSKTTEGKKYTLYTTPDVINHFRLGFGHCNQELFIGTKFLYD